MLAASARLRNRDEFTRTVSRGRRATRGSVVVHVGVAAESPPTSLVGEPGGTRATSGMRLPSERPPGPTKALDQKNPASGDAWLSPRAGFVVSRAVGGAVQRNRVRRRLRHLMRDRLSSLPIGADVVVRALPGAATRSFAELGVDLERALAAAVAGRPRGAGVDERGSR
jgi:ribonuclease P protein component